MQATCALLNVVFLGLFVFAGRSANWGAPPSADPDLKKTENQPNMATSVSTLLTRNLNDVFGENDPVRRRKAIDEIFTEDAVFYEPRAAVYRGRDEIDRIAGQLRTMHPDFRYQQIGEPEEVGNGGRVRWTEGRPGEKPAVAGTDFIVTRDGRIAAIYLFVDKLP
jgi:SnoaL-like domain